MYIYKTYGLVIASELMLPELISWLDSDIPDVYIATQSLEETLENADFSDNTSFCDISFQVAQDSCQINAQGVARYRIEKGKYIFVDADPGVAEGDVRLYLLGSGLGALLHQRRSLPLHVSSIVTPNGVWAFTGPSGAGKSTLAATLHYKLGWPLLSDDVAVVLPNPSESTALHAGPPRLKLWQDALERLDISQDGLVPDLVRSNKFHLKLDKKFQQQSTSLRSLVWLERAKPHEPASLIPINNVDSFQIIMAAIYRPNFAAYLNDATSIFQFCSLLTRKVQVFRYRRPWDLDNIDFSLEPLLERIKVAE